MLRQNEVTHDDVAICARLIDAFNRALTYEQDQIPSRNRPTGDLWMQLGIQAHGEGYRFLASNDAVGLAHYLANGLRTSLCIGLGPGPVIFRAMSGGGWRDPMLLLVDRLVAVAEAVGVLAHENPEQGRYGQNIHIAIPDLITAIENKVRFSIHRPLVMGIYGIGVDSGAIDFRVPDDTYCAHRLRMIGDDIAETSFIEIGGGFGGMALFALRAGATHWQMVDLPIMNVVQGYFLIKSLGENSVSLFGENNSAADVEVLPYWEFFNPLRRYSVVFNRDSLPEIQRSRVDEYLAEIEARGAVLLSINQEAGAPGGDDGLLQLNLLQIIAERGKLECRFRHPYWVRKGYVEELFAPLRR